MESVALSVNYLPLLLIFLVILVCKLLRSVLYPLTYWVVRGVTSSPCGVDRIRNEISDLKREIGDISTTEDFAAYSRLKRQQVTKETELGMIEGEYRSKLLQRQALCVTLATIFLEVLPVMVVIYWRSVPVLVLPGDHLWPLGGLVRFPTQAVGGVGAPIWALCTRQSLKAATAAISSK